MSRLDAEPPGSDLRVDDVVRLDLGPLADRSNAPDDGPDGWRGRRPHEGLRAGPPPRDWSDLRGRPDARLLVALALAVLVVAAAAAPQPRPVPSAGDVGVVLAPGPLVPMTLDTLTVRARVTNDGPVAFDVRGARLVTSGDPGPVVPPVTVPAGGRAWLSLPARPDCASPDDQVMALDLGTPGGSALVRLRVAGAAEALAELCPPPLPGAHARVTGSRTDASGMGVEVRVVNHGTVRLDVGPSGAPERRQSRSVIESGTGLTLAELGDVGSAQPLLAGYPQLPVTLDPGQATTVVLLPIVDPCATDATAATLQAGGPGGAQPVENQDVVRAELLAAAARLCAQRG